MLPDFRVHHIGSAVRNIAETAAHYTRAGWKLSEPVVDPVQNTEIAFLTKAGEPTIELVAPVNDSSPIVQTLEKSGVSPYHICYEVTDIDAAVTELKKRRYLPLFRPVEATALGNRKICYLYHPQTGLIELVNTK